MTSRFIIVATLALAFGGSLAFADPKAAELESQFSGAVHPFIETYCFSCHGKEKQKGDLDLSAFGTMDAVAGDYSRWETVIDKLESEDMPPDDAKRHPEAAQTKEVVNWIKALRRYEGDANAGDPGPVLARRLSNAEYDYTIRDLTGFDIRPTREFPVDPANQAGFDNSGESLNMSPGLFKKYLEAARDVSDHLVLKPRGLAFAPFAVMTDTDRDKYCVGRIMDFYRRQRTDYADYFFAAWRFEHRAALGKPAASLAELAAEGGLSAKYLATVWSTLTETTDRIGPMAALVALWLDLPSDVNDERGARAGCEQMRNFVTTLRAKLVPEVKNMSAPGTSLSPGNQAFVLWKDRQMALNRRRYTGGALTISPDAALKNSEAVAAMAIPTNPGEAEEYEATFPLFCSTFPDAFVVSERARVFLGNDDAKNVGRYLSAGFHNTMGYFRDDRPLYDLALDEAAQRELDELWQELDFVTDAPARQHSGFLWSERADSTYMRDSEFDFARSEDKDVGSEEKIKRLAEVYLAKAERRGAGKLQLETIAENFRNISASIRWVEQARVVAEPTHLPALQDFAERAFRRPLSVEERADIAKFYRSLRDKDGLSHEDAIRDTLVSILMSPYFCYRADLVDAGVGIHPLSDYALASRLSYFLWSSMPDEKLLARAAAGDLHQPEVIAAEARRMLADPRIRDFALEFAGNWLDIRRFEEWNSVDRERFTSFTNELRSAMFEEPIRFFIDVVQKDRSILDFLYADRTFVNPVLAKHYGMPVTDAPDHWTEIDDAHHYDRGGLLPMAVFLTKNAPGDRTSPVKRGNWVIRRLLGERIPPPPAKVPELPSDEAKLGTLTLREALARHREDKSCAGCHERFDGIGLAFEGFGPVGERRSEDLGGRPIDAHASFPGGSDGAGVPGLADYIRAHRQADFVNNLSSKLLAYALGRGVMLSDDQLIREMSERLARDDYHFGDLIEAVVTSRQFLNKRGSEAFTER